MTTCRLITNLFFYVHQLPESTNFWELVTVRFSRFLKYKSWEPERFLPNLIIGIWLTVKTSKGYKHVVLWNNSLKLVHVCNIMICDESCCYGYDPEAESKQWNNSLSLCPVQCGQIKSNIKTKFLVMLSYPDLCTHRHMSESPSVPLKFIMTKKLQPCLVCITMWSIWFWILPSFESHACLCIFLCSKIVDLTNILCPRHIYKSGSVSTGYII